MALASACGQGVRRLKAASRRVAHQKGIDGFAWQEGFGAFSVSPSDVRMVARYVENQARHHGDGSVQTAMEIGDYSAAEPEGHLEA
jgi:hypothetical protein